MTRRAQYTPEERAEVVELAQSLGVAEAARQSGVKAGTVKGWMHRAGARAPEPKAPAELNGIVTAAAASAAVNLAALADRKAALAVKLMGDLEVIRGRLTAPHVEKVVRTVSLGQNSGSVTEIVDVELSMPSPTDQRALMNALSTGIDTVQLLTGEATERIEQVTVDGGTKERQATAVDALDELAERRAQRSA